MNKLSETTTWKEIEIDHSVFGFTIGGLQYGTYLITAHPSMLKIWSIEKLPTITFVSEIATPHSFEAMKLKGDKVYLYGGSFKQCFLIIDIANPTAPQLLRECLVEDLTNVFENENEVYANVYNDIVKIEENDDIKKLIEIPEQDRFDSYPSDLYKIENTLYVVGRHPGLYIYTTADGSTWEQQSKHKVGYTPTRIHWEKLGEKMLLVGNSEVIRYDVTNPQKPKRFKACKFKSTELFTGYAQQGNEILVAGNKGAKDKFVLGVVELGESELTMVQQPTIEYKEREKYGEAVAGLVLKDNYLLLLGKKTGVYVFEGIK